MSVPSLSSEYFTHIAVSSATACATTTKNRILCWGDNTYGTYGNGTQTSTLQVQSADLSGVPAGTRWNQIAGDVYHFCALTQTGRLYCWGYNAQGQIGNGSSISPVTRPTAVVDTMLDSNQNERFVTVSVDEQISCAITTLGNVYCWGARDRMIGDGGPDTGLARVPTRIDTTNLNSGEVFVNIATGVFGACSTTNLNRVLCWGSDTYLGFSGSSIPLEVPMGSMGDNASQSYYVLDIGYNALCTLSESGHPYCMGGNDLGQLGTGLRNDHKSEFFPVDLNGVGIPMLKSLDFGFHYAVGISTDKRVLWWGYDLNGTYDDYSGDYLVPTEVNLELLDDDDAPAEIKAGMNSSCFVSEKGKAYCWGQNTGGVLGTGAAVEAGDTALKSVNFSYSSLD